MAGSTTILPATNVFWVANAEKALMRFFLPGFQLVAPMAGNTFAMSF